MPFVMGTLATSHSLYPFDHCTCSAFPDIVSKRLTKILLRQLMASLVSCSFSSHSGCLLNGELENPGGDKLVTQMPPWRYIPWKQALVLHRRWR